MRFPTPDTGDNNAAYWRKRAEDAERQPNLGLATTRELLDELRARIEVDYASGGGGLDYTTVHGRPEAALGGLQ
jgi:hypothetical protein